MKLWMKILLTVLTTVIVLIGGAIAALIAMISGGGNFYAGMVTACAIAVWLFVIVQIWGVLSRKIRYTLLGASAGILLLLIAGFEIRRIYVGSIGEVNEQGVDLTLYEPFREDTKTVSLNGESSLKLSYNLPKMDGATALYPLYSAFAKAVYPKGYYMPDIHKNDDDYVVCTQTDGAYMRLIAGDADVIFVAGPSQEQLQMAKAGGLELKLTPIGREAFVFFVNAKNPVSNLSVSDVQRIYSGEADNWKEFGGKNAEIRAFQRPVNSGSQTALITLMGDVPLMTPPTDRVIGLMGDIITTVAYKNYSNAIGYSFLFFATEMVNDNKIKLLSLNGVEPTRENVANQTYPYASEFYAVTAGTNNPNTEKLIEWILSEQGQYLVEKTGYTPLSTGNGGDEEVGYKKLAPKEAQSKMTDGTVILDVRTQEEYDAGHIKGAVLLPDYEIRDGAADVLPDKDKTILVYCRSGRRSQAASMELIAMGYTQVYDFGGIIDWTGEITK